MAVRPPPRCPAYSGARSGAHPARSWLRGVSPPILAGRLWSGRTFLTVAKRARFSGHGDLARYSGGNRCRPRKAAAHRCHPTRDHRRQLWRLHDDVGGNTQTDRFQGCRGPRAGISNWLSYYGGGKRHRRLDAARILEPPPMRIRPSTPSRRRSTSSAMSETPTFAYVGERDTSNVPRRRLRSFWHALKAPQRCPPPL